MNNEFKIFLDKLFNKEKDLNEFGRAYLTETIYVERAQTNASLIFVKTSTVLNLNVKDFFSEINNLVEQDLSKHLIYIKLYNMWTNEVSKERLYRKAVSITNGASL